MGAGQCFLSFFTGSLLDLHHIVIGTKRIFVSYSYPSVLTLYLHSLWINNDLNSQELQPCGWTWSLFIVGYHLKTLIRIAEKTTLQILNYEQLLIFLCADKIPLPPPPPPPLPILIWFVHSENLNANIIH